MTVCCVHGTTGGTGRLFRLLVDCHCPTSERVAYPTAGCPLVSVLEWPDSSGHRSPQRGKLLHLPPECVLRQRGIPPELQPSDVSGRRTSRRHLISAILRSNRPAESHVITSSEDSEADG